MSRRTGEAIALSKLQELLQNPFYYGLIKHKGELYQGSHEPIISKQLFDKVQRTLLQRGKPRKAKDNISFAFLGVFRCGECGRSITAERKIKKSGRTYHYYRCTKKNRICSQKYLEEKELVKQLNELCQKVALSDEWKEQFLKKWELDSKELSTKSDPSAQNLKNELKQLEEKQMRLLDAYLDKTITNEEYIAAKEKIINRKVEIKEAMSDFGRKGNNWLEPFKEFVRLLRTHLEGVVAWTRLRVSNGALEGMNNKIKLVSHRSFGFRSVRNYTAAIYHCCARLSLPADC